MILKQMQRKALQQKETQFKLNGRAVQDRKLMSLRKKMERQRIVMQEMGTTPESIAYCTPPTVTNNFLYPKYRQSTIETNPMNVLGPFSHEVSYINTSNITRAEDLGRFDHQNGEIFYMEMEDRDTLGSYLPLPRNLDEIDAQLVYMENLDILYESHISNTQENSYSVQEEAHREILAGFGPLMSLSEVDVLMSNT